MARQKITEAVRHGVIERDGLYCRYCGFGPMLLDWRIDPHYRKRLTCRVIGGDLGTLLNLDHLDCVNGGGKSNPENLAVSCARCNMRKGTRPRQELLPPAPVSLLPAPPAHAIADRRAGNWAA